MSQRTDALANRLEEGARALATFASTLTDQEWQARLPKDGRKVGVIVHHVATVFPRFLPFPFRSGGSMQHRCVMEGVRHG